MRRKIFEIIEVADENNRLSAYYDILMMFTIGLSLLPLAFREQTFFLELVDKITVFIFIADYILRLLTADFKLKKRKVSAFLRYPFTPMAIIDLLCILPSLSFMNRTFRLLKIFRMARTFRVLRIRKSVRYSKSVMMIIDVFNIIKQECPSS